MARLPQRLIRLRNMSRDEVVQRIKQFTVSRADWMRSRRGESFTDLQSLNDRPTGSFFFSPADVAGLIEAMREIFPNETLAIVSRATSICDHKFDLLGYTNLDYGSPIDWHRDIVHGKRGPRVPWFKIHYLDFDEVGDAKITWELNRHQHFVVLAKAYRLTGDDRYIREIMSQSLHWLSENPYPVGMNWASSLEVAFRSFSWIWTYFLLQECPEFDGSVRQKWMAMLSLSGRHIETYLSTYFSPNTHLLGEAMSLFYLGTLFDLPSSERWQRLGWKILVEEAAKQVREDGFYFEQSTYYHVYALDMFLHARVLAARNGFAIPPDFDGVIQRMLEALALMSNAGVPPMFGDDDGGRLFDARRNRASHMMDPLATGAVLYARGDFKKLAGSFREESLWLLGLQGVSAFDSLQPAVLPDSPSALVHSGFYVMRDEKSNQQLVVDAGPLGAGSGGHGHADALSMCLVRDGKTLLRDSGTFEYVGGDGERSRLRSTKSHNTLRIDGRDQAAPTGAFTWDRLSEVSVLRWVDGQRVAWLDASHDGFARQDSQAVHRRQVFHRKDEFWLVRDVVEGAGRHELELSWHLGVGLCADPVRPTTHFNSDETRLAVLTGDGANWSTEIATENWSPAYGSVANSLVLRTRTHALLPADFVTLLSADAHRAEEPTLLEVGEAQGNVIRGYRYRRGTTTGEFFFSLRPGTWTCGAWTSDADFLYVQASAEEPADLLFFVNATQVDHEAGRLISCGEPVEWAEVFRQRDVWHLSSSNPDKVEISSVPAGARQEFTRR